ncbi:MAG: hypothetical protein JJE51_09915 [Thermoanaerobaculia bacterium]|nr:hypothetical protein [Thermoanaerobaculia bacterium]
MRGLSRIAAAATVAIAIAILVHIALAGAPRAESLAFAAVALLVAGAVGLFAPPAVAVEPPHVSATPVVDDAAPEAKERESSVLVANIISADGSARLREDLERVLSGIVADERGKITAHDGAGIFATFRRANHAAAAVHAAQRMLSNVDAVARRLEREIRISIAVHSGAGSLDAAALEISNLTRDKRVSVLVSGATQSRAGSEASSLALVDEQPMPLFSFAPVQRTLF